MNTIYHIESFQEIAPKPHGHYSGGIFLKYKGAQNGTTWMIKNVEIGYAINEYISSKLCTITIYLIIHRKLL